MPKVMGHGHSSHKKCPRLDQVTTPRSQTNYVEACSFVRSTGTLYTMSDSKDIPDAAKIIEDPFDDDVFKDDESPRYHNFPLLEKSKPRRQSSIRERLGSLGSDNFKYLPQWDTDDHSLRHASFPRKRCSKCIMGTLRTSNTQDIFILSSGSGEDAAFFVKFLSNYFGEITLQPNKKPLNVRCVTLEDLMTKNDEEFEKMTRKSLDYKLQLVIICRTFLDFITEHARACKRLSRLLLDDRTLALLLDVSIVDFEDLHKQILPSFPQWPKHVIGPDLEENFAREFLDQALSILSRVWKEQYMSTSSREKPCFSITPKKIRQGQSGVFVFLTYPLQKDDIVKVSVAKHGELYEMSTVKRRNPYVIKFSVPESLTDVTTMLQVLVEKNGSIIGSKPLKCESKLREMEEILRTANNPVSFMCQTLKFNNFDKDSLDEWFTNAFLESKPQDFDLISSRINTPNVHLTDRSNEEFPTLLHFAARFGLEKLAAELSSCANVATACRLRNVEDLTPLKLAEKHGHSNIVSNLRRYQMETCTTPQEPDLDAEGYMVPKIFREYYKTCPVPRPLDLNPLTPASDCSYSFNPALNQYEDISDSDTVTLQEEVQKLTIEPDKLVQISSQYKLNEAIEESVQKELVEIIRNNAPSEADAEKLLEYWRTHSTHFDGYNTASKKLKPLERIRNIFWKQHRPDKGEASTSRPRSSLSACSPTSTTRCIRYSFTDDVEDRRTFLRSQSEDYSGRKRHESVDSSYSLVPTPKPVKIIPSKKEKTARRPRNLSLKEEFYKFPPCGEPVQVVQNAGSSISNDTNSGNHEYMNCKVTSE